MSRSITGADSIARKFAVNLQPAIEAGLLGVAEQVQSVMASYPSASGKKQPPKTAKQRRFLHALGRRGGIPYRRSGDLGRAWQPKKLGPLRIALVNTQSYATLVHGGKGYHAGTWKSTTQGADAVRPLVKGIMTPPIVNTLRGNS